jgi:hypothetical protein
MQKVYNEIYVFIVIQAGKEETEEKKEQHCIA